jgi:hypothetical protein
MLRPLYSRERPGTNYTRSWVAPGPVWTGAGNLVPTGIRSPDRPARSDSLYRLSYTGQRRRKKNTKILFYSQLSTMWCFVDWYQLFRDAWRMVQQNCHVTKNHNLHRFHCEDHKIKIAYYAGRLYRMHPYINLTLPGLRGKCKQKSPPYFWFPLVSLHGVTFHKFLYPKSIHKQYCPRTHW